MPAFDHLTTTATRARVAAALDDHLAIDMGAALLLADVLDSVSAAVCRTAGLTDAEATAGLGLLWRSEPAGPQPAPMDSRDVADLASAVADLPAAAAAALLADLAVHDTDAVRRALTRRMLDGGSR